MFAYIAQLAFVAASLVAANPHARGPHGRHHDIAKRVAGDVQVHNFGKRFDNARWSFYDVGMGACGKTSQPDDFIVALNSPQYGGGYPGPQCFKMITMTYNGKTTQAQIMDECPGCPRGGLDLSRGLFKFFAPESVGILYGQWEFSDGSGGDDKPKTTEKPKPTTTKEPEPSTKKDTPSPKPDNAPKPSPSSSSQKSSPSSSAPSSSAAPAPTGMVEAIEQAVMRMGGMILAGYRA